MRNYMILTVLLIAAFLLGTLMPKEPKIKVQEKVITQTIKDTIVNNQVVSVPVEKKVTEYVYIKQIDTVKIKDTVYVKIPRQHYFAETEDVKIWHSGIDSRIDSLVNFRETKIVQVDSWKRHNIRLSGQVGFNSLGAGAEYEYNLFKWFSISAQAGYDFYLKKPYVMAGINLELYSW